MSFVCFACRRPTLEIVHGIELGSDGRSDEYTFQTLRCSACAFMGVGYYEESRRGREPRFHHRGFLTSPADFAEVSRALEACPSRADDRCDCPTHRVYGQQEHAMIDPIARVPSAVSMGPLELVRDGSAVVDRVRERGAPRWFWRALWGSLAVGLVAWFWMAFGRP